MCTHCGKELPLDQFYRKSNSPDGYQYWCKECLITARKARSKGPKGLAKYSDSQLVTVLEGCSHKVLIDPSPRALMEMLAKMGYRGKLEYTETHVIDINDF